MTRRGRKKAPESYRLRSYRSLAREEGLVSTFFRLRETDLHILAEVEVGGPAGELATRLRLQIEGYIGQRPEFGTALLPLDQDELAPAVVRRMLAAASAAGVGPMAAVAGGIAEMVGRGLLEAGHKEIIVENGGDIFLRRSVEQVVAVFAGESPLSNRLGLRIAPALMPLGVCTSSGTVGHSLSFGTADSVTVLAASAFLADAVATRLGNEVGGVAAGRKGIDRALALARTISGLAGVLIIRGETIGAVGEIDLIALDGRQG